MTDTYSRLHTTRRNLLCHAATACAMPVLPTAARTKSDRPAPTDLTLEPTALPWEFASDDDLGESYKESLLAFLDTNGRLDTIDEAAGQYYAPLDRCQEPTPVSAQTAIITAESKADTETIRTGLEQWVTDEADIGCSDCPEPRLTRRSGNRHTKWVYSQPFRDGTYRVVFTYQQFVDVHILVRTWAYDDQPSPVQIAAQIQQRLQQQYRTAADHLRGHQ